MIKRALAGAAVLALCPLASATINFIDFESDLIGPRSNGFMSLSSPLVTFTDSEGEDLYIDDYGLESDGHALAVGTDRDQSILIMDFAATIDSLSMDFGNDEPSYIFPGDYALLSAFLDGEFIGQTLVELNANDAMDQSISFSGDFFNSATIEFYVSGNPGGVTEIVDNISFNTIPAPGAGLIVAASALVRAGRRRREA